MPNRPEGPDPPAVWTRKQVVVWMVSAWSAGRRPSFQGQVATRSALDWCTLYLPIAEPMRDAARDYLLVWIWTKSERESFRDVCRLRSWSRSTAMRWVEWALMHIVAGLNRDEAKLVRDRGRS